MSTRKRSRSSSSSSSSANEFQTSSKNTAKPSAPAASPPDDEDAGDADVRMSPSSSSPPQSDLDADGGDEDVASVPSPKNSTSSHGTSSRSHTGGAPKGVKRKVYSARDKLKAVDYLEKTVCGNITQASRDLTVDRKSLKLWQSKRSVLEENAHDERDNWRTDPIVARPTGEPVRPVPKANRPCTFDGCRYQRKTACPQRMCKVHCRLVGKACPEHKFKESGSGAASDDDDMTDRVGDKSSETSTKDTKFDVMQDTKENQPPPFRKEDFGDNMVGQVLRAQIDDSFDNGNFITVNCKGYLLKGMFFEDSSVGEVRRIAEEHRRFMLGETKDSPSEGSVVKAGKQEVTS